MQRSGSNGGVSSGSAGEEIINRAGGRERRITIHVTGQDGSTTMFTISRNLRLRVLFLNYCERKQLNYRTARFLHQGVRVLGRRTPAEVPFLLLFHASDRETECVRVEMEELLYKHAGSNGFGGFNFTSGPAARNFCRNEQPEHSAYRGSSFGGITHTANHQVGIVWLASVL
ncbi:hypothetical protein V6N13_026192 [Hibiscus sabdariffa]